MSDMGTCATCRHWKHPLDGYGSILEFEYHPERSQEEQDAREAAYDVLYGECMAVVFSPEEKDYPTPEEAPTAVVLDGSRYMAALYTKAEFNCSLYEGMPGE